MVVLQWLLYGLCVGMLFRCYKNWKRLIGNIQWFTEQKRAVPDHFLSNTSVIVCLPMLREQRLVEKTLSYFQSMLPPAGDYTIIVVSTKKEEVQKRQRRTQLDSFCQEVLSGSSEQYLIDTYIGLFDVDRLCLIISQLKKCATDAEAYSLVERIYDQLPSTRELAEYFVRNGTSNGPSVHVIEYPGADGVMAHQVNYAAAWAAKHVPNASESFFAIYNADSRPDKATFVSLAHSVDTFEHRHGQTVNILQQSSLFLSNYTTFPSDFQGTLLRVCALMQSKWTLVHELDRLRTQSTYAPTAKGTWWDIITRSRISHCVGHGLFIRLSYLLNHPLPTALVTEDLPFGFYRSCERTPIVPIPLLENAESPATLSGVLNQKRVWFWPYVQYLSCRARVLTQGDYQSRFEVNWLTTQGLTVGFIWLLQSFAFFLPLVGGILYKDLTLLILWMLTLYCYWVWPVKRIHKVLPELMPECPAKHVGWREFAGIVPFLALYSLGPWLTVVDSLKCRFFGCTPQKKKTER